MALPSRIIEGLNAWTIPLWLFLRQRTIWNDFILCTVLYINWYFGACICVMACFFLSVQYRFVAWSFLGLPLILPFLVMFLENWQVPTIDVAVRHSMGISYKVFYQNIAGKNNYLSWIVIAMVVQYRSRYSLILIGSILLSNNILGSFPIFEHIRFPYRFHILTLICAGCLVAPHVKQFWLAYAIFLEQILLGGLTFQMSTQDTQPRRLFLGE